MNEAALSVTHHTPSALCVGLEKKRGRASSYLREGL